MCGIVETLLLDAIPVSVFAGTDSVDSSEAGTGRALSLLLPVVSVLTSPSAAASAAGDFLAVEPFAPGFAVEDCLTNISVGNHSSSRSCSVKY